MIQDFSPKEYDVTYKECEATPEDYCLIFTGNSKANELILCKICEDILDIPTVQQVKGWTHDALNLSFRYLFEVNKKKFFLLQNTELILDKYYSKESYKYETIRSLRRVQPLNLCFGAVCGYHLYVWYRDNVFCGRCQQKLIHATNERMLKCPACNNMVFPKIAPAVIIGVIKDDSILLSRYANRAYKGIALLAGFIEIGETPEDTVRREVMEEVGLKVKNIQAFSSQPWGFDMNLLLGYFCELDGDASITLDENELEVASFVRREEIPVQDNTLSLTATMIEAFRNEQIHKVDI